MAIPFIPLVSYLPPISTCEVCNDMLFWIDSNKGGWWRHRFRPDDDHVTQKEAPVHD